MQKRRHVREKLHGIRAFPARIGIRKVHSDIAERRGAEKRVHHGVDENVGVAMPKKTLFKWNFDAANHALPPRDEAVCVETRSDAKRNESAHPVYGIAKRRGGAMASRRRVVG